MGKMIMKKCVFEQNEAMGNSKGGGAIYNYLGELDMETCVFRHNIANVSLRPPPHGCSVTDVGYYPSPPTLNKAH